MRRRQLVLVGGASFALVAAVVAAWSIAVLRTCDQNSNVRRGSLAFRLCSMDNELVSSIPLRDPLDEPLFSWQSADGNKPGRKWVSYSSSAPQLELRRQLIEFLKTSGFAPQGNDGAFELWSNGRTVLGFEVLPVEAGKTNRVEVVHNTGLD